MHLLILVTLAAAATAAPQIEPYVHEEIPAEPYIHVEPALSALALGEVRPAQAKAAPQQFAAPVQQFAPAAPVQQFAPQQFAAPAGPVGWAGYCINNRGEGVPCRKQF